jgi:hypothetical protein
MLNILWHVSKLPAGQQPETHDHTVMAIIADTLNDSFKWFKTSSSTWMSGPVPPFTAKCTSGQSANRQGLPAGQEARQATARPNFCWAWFQVTSPQGTWAGFPAAAGVEKRSFHIISGDGSHVKHALNYVVVATD